ncbi:MAG: hypothetical protein ACD_80C00226G0006 [uncultured bacterium (gcode 4)]|uniref:DUF4935 domain-containing protein n=1 Tax=uncultured bacterium (gcode 4) TaxID=1234023 RepID=K1XVK4_9BACT|nr:MAG: hypothetical protein ACD_80C00226G0006 [uncultured bacterium (gcode 4)]
MTEKVIFDTNKLRDKEANLWFFFGNRGDLEKFSKVSEIIIPDMVIEELKRQKKRSLENKKQSFLENPIHWILGTSKPERENFDIASHIQKLEDAENISYSVIKLTDYSVIEQMKELALQKAAPFENGENTDKWFKDAYTYFTVLEYLKTIEDSYVFFVCKDGRLVEAFDGNERVRVVSDFDEFEKQRISYFQEEYFLKEMSTRINFPVNTKDVVWAWLNISGNRVVKIISEWPTFLVEVDFSTKEIIDHIIEEVLIEEDSLSDAINYLIHSRNFDETDFYVGQLMPYTQYFTDQQIIELLEASTSNNQIYRIAEKDDLKSFFKSLFEHKKNSLGDETKKLFIKYFWE